MQRDNPIVATFYNGKTWKATRNAYYKSKYGMCEKCGTCNGKMIVHHKTWINATNVNDTNITLNWDNLQLLCLDCHNEVHFKEKDKWMFDENGDLISYEK